MILSVIIQDIKKRPIAFVAMLVLVVLGINLGSWQLRRADVKIHQAQDIADKALLPTLNANNKYWTLDESMYRQMEVTGFWIPEKAIWLENRPHPRGKDPKTGIATGFNLLMPFQIDNEHKNVLWVNRGWVTRDFQQINRVPELKIERGRVSIVGVVFPDSGKTFQLSAEVENRASDGLKIQENHFLKDDEFFSKRLFPFVLREQNTHDSNGLDQTLPILNTGVNTHYGYAFQWFSLALMTFLYWLYNAFRKRFQSLR